jgi:hypothetical protein
MTQLPAHLHKLLLVGTSRAPFGAATLPPELAAVLPDAGATPERSLWLAAGALDLFDRAGYLPPPASGQPAPPSAAEQLAPCPPLAEAILRRLLHESFPAPLLQEWLMLLNARHARLPARFLPNLLELATRQAGLRPLVAPSLGTRGRWLSQAEAGWSWAVETDADGQLQEAWQNGSPEQRSTALAAWRRQDPAAARAALQAGWTSEPPEQRIAFIGSLAIGLEAADEDFLEAALDDRRKGVRTEARRLLARLPGSRLSQRMLAHAAPLLQVEKRFLRGSRLLVTPPAVCDAAMARDGVGETSHPGLGEKAGWLADILAAIAPSHWSEQFDLAPDDCIALSAGTDYQEALLRGWTTALHLHLAHAATPGLLAWLAAWTRIWLKSDGTIRYQNAAAFVGAYTSLPPPAMHALLLGLVDASARSWSGGEVPLAELLQRLAESSAAPWPAALSQAIAMRLLPSLASLSSQQWAYRAALSALALVLDPAAVLAVQPQGPALGEDAQGWQGPIDQFFHVVRLRHEMISSFQEPA